MQTKVKNHLVFAPAQNQYSKRTFVRAQQIQAVIKWRDALWMKS